MAKNQGEKKPRRSGVLIGLVKLLFLDDIIGHPKSAKFGAVFVFVHVNNWAPCDSKLGRIETIEPKLPNRMGYQSFQYFGLHFKS